MKVKRFQHLINNPYQYLLFSLIIFLLSFPLIDTNSFLGFIILTGTFLMITVSVIATFDLALRKRYILIFIAITSFVSTIFSNYFNNSHNQFFQGFNQLINFLFMTIAVLIIVRKIFRDKKITGDTLRGGISVYLMVGILWFQIYTIIDDLDSNAFSRPVTPHQLLYFSFVTLTTVGYGDISPIHPVAMIFANLEAIVGQLYPAIIIARLVSLYSSSDSQ